MTKTQICESGNIMHHCCCVNIVLDIAVLRNSTIPLHCGCEFRTSSRHTRFLIKHKYAFFAVCISLVCFSLSQVTHAPPMTSSVPGKMTLLYYRAICPTPAWSSRPPSTSLSGFVRAMTSPSSFSSESTTPACIPAMMVSWSASPTFRDPFSKPLGLWLVLLSGRSISAYSNCALLSAGFFLFILPKSLLCSWPLWYKGCLWGKESLSKLKIPEKTDCNFLCCV